MSLNQTSAKYSISVIVNSKTDSVEELTEDSLRVKMNVKPIDGEANKRLLAVLAKHFRVPKSSVKICTGLRSRKKIVEISLN